MITKKQIQFIQSLQRKKERVNAQMFVVEGKKMVEELLENYADLTKELYTTDDLFAKKHNASLVEEHQIAGR